MSAPFIVNNGYVTKRQLAAALDPKFRPVRDTFTINTSGPGLKHRGASSAGKHDFIARSVQFKRVAQPKTFVGQLRALGRKARHQKRARELNALLGSLSSAHPDPRLVSKLAMSLSKLHSRKDFDLDLPPGHDADVYAATVKEAVDKLLTAYQTDRASSGIAIGAEGFLRMLQNKFSPAARISDTQSGIAELERHKNILEARKLLADTGTDKMRREDLAVLDQKLTAVGRQLDEARQLVFKEQIEAAQARAAGMEKAMRLKEIAIAKGVAQDLSAAIAEDRADAVEQIARGLAVASGAADTGKELVACLNSDLTREKIPASQREVTALNAGLHIANAVGEMTAQAMLNPATSPAMKKAMALFTPQQRLALEQQAIASGPSGTLVFDKLANEFQRKPANRIAKAEH